MFTFVIHNITVSLIYPCAVLEGFGFKTMFAVLNERSRLRGIKLKFLCLQMVRETSSSAIVFLVVIIKIIAHLDYLLYKYLVP